MTLRNSAVDAKAEKVVGWESRQKTTDDFVLPGFPNESLGGKVGVFPKGKGRQVRKRATSGAEAESVAADGDSGEVFSTDSELDSLNDINNI